jgi:type I restriction enzyme R subunit
MIVWNGIARAIDYWREVSDYLMQIKSPYKAIVAYSGEFEIGGHKKTEADLNGFNASAAPPTFGAKGPANGAAIASPVDTVSATGR